MQYNAKTIETILCDALTGKNIRLYKYTYKIEDGEKVVYDLTPFGDNCSEAICEIFSVTLRKKKEFILHLDFFENGKRGYTAIRQHDTLIFVETSDKLNVIGGFLS